MFIVPWISSSENRGRISGLENISEKIVQKYRVIKYDRKIKGRRERRPTHA